MRRLVLLSLVALALAACGRDAGRAFLDTRTPPSLGPRFWAPDGWAWGTIEVKGAPEVRYGVAGPAAGRSDKVMIIATGYGESAEVYFETVHDLNVRGWTVWVIEPHGQGGSGRFPGPRDVGRSAGFDKDAEAIRYLIENVIRPRLDDEVTMVAHGSAALPALLAVEAGLPRVDRLHLWDPDVAAPGQADVARHMSRLGLGGLRASGAPWKRPAGDLTRRAALPLAWPVANPDLRMGGPAWSWIDAKATAVTDATSPEALKKVGVWVGVSRLTGNSAAKRLIPHLKCFWGEVADLSPPVNGPLSSTENRQSWIDDIVGVRPPFTGPNLPPDSACPPLPAQPPSQTGPQP